jgi:VanZ family protein
VKHPRRLKLRVNRFALLRIGSWISVAVWAGTIIWLSSLSGDELAKLGFIKVWDKAAHFLAFALGATLLSVALRLSTQWHWKNIAWIALIAIAFFGATDEWHQRYTPRRHGADVADWITDTVGAMAGILIALAIHARHQRKNCPSPVPD